MSHLDQVVKQPPKLVTVVGLMPDVLMVFSKLGLISPLWIAPLGPRLLEALKGLNDRKELRWWDNEPCLVGVLSCLLLGGWVT